MGYMTTYSLVAQNVEENDLAKIIELLDEKQIYGYAVGKRNDSYDRVAKIAVFDSCGDCSWSDHHEEMLEIAAAVPNVTFCLNGVGEERDDIWNAYYKGSEYEHCPATIVYKDPEKIVWEEGW